MAGGGDAELRATLKGLHGRVLRVADILEALLVAPPDPSQWPDWTGRMTAALAQYEAVGRELGPLLHRLALVPGTRPGGNLEVITNVYLRTRFAPEIEQTLKPRDQPRLGSDQATSKDPPSSLTSPSLSPTAPATRAKVARMLQEAAESLKGSGGGPPSRTSSTVGSGAVVDERVLRWIRQHYIL